MLREIIRIDRDVCNGCGLCVTACHEGAIGMKDGKAVLLRDDYCDGLGACLPACPTGAISFERREAAAFDQAAVDARIAGETGLEAGPLPCPGGTCPGARAEALAPDATGGAPGFTTLRSELTNFPVQIRLVAPNAAFFQGAHLLVAADCAAYAHGDFHRRFMRGHVTLIGCPKLDGTDYAVKLGEILRGNDIRSLTLVHMEVPCCGGLARAAEEALRNSGRNIPFETLTLSTGAKSRISSAERCLRPIS